MTVDLKAVGTDLAAVSVLMPQLAAAYAAYKAIWMIANPGKTEADYVQHLDETAKSSISAADAVLIADGFVQDAKGNWSKPAPPVVSSP